jgi:2-methylcitrate dehydratase PrpD
MPDLHPSGVIAPVALAVSEWQDASAAQLLLAYALGLELCVRIGRAGYDSSARTSRFLQRGQDATAICGTVAGAAVAARLLGLVPAIAGARVIPTPPPRGREGARRSCSRSVALHRFWVLEPRGIADAIGIAVSLASGSLESNRSGGTIKRLQSGWAASSAIRAACLARAGVSGPAAAFEGRYGFYRCFLDGTFNAAMLAGDLGLRWEVLSLRMKPYPSNYYTHAGIDAALGMVRGGVRPDEIRSAELAVATPMLHTIGEPLDRKQAPRSAYEAKFSGPYAVAAALLGGVVLESGSMTSPTRWCMIRLAAR